MIIPWCHFIPKHVISYLQLSFHRVSIHTPTSRFIPFVTSSCEGLVRGNVIIYMAQKAIQGDDCRPRWRSWPRFPLARSYPRQSVSSYPDVISYQNLSFHTCSCHFIPLGYQFIPPPVISYPRQSVSYPLDTNSYHMVCDHTLMSFHTKTCHFIPAVVIS